MNTKLNDAAISLQDIARIIEKELGQGSLSIDVIRCAERLQAVAMAESIYREKSIKKSKETV